MANSKGSSSPANKEPTDLELKVYFAKIILFFFIGILLSLVARVVFKFFIKLLEKLWIRFQVSYLNKHLSENVEAKENKQMLSVTAKLVAISILILSILLSDTFFGTFKMAGNYMAKFGFTKEAFKKAAPVLGHMVTFGFLSVGFIKIAFFTYFN